MRKRTELVIVSVICLTMVFALPSGADELKANTTWQEVTTKGASLVFGRLEGEFDGPEFRNRRIELNRLENGKEYSIPVGEGLGYFEAIMPAGNYQVTGIEAVYYPVTNLPMDPGRYRPVRQRFGVHSTPAEGRGASFPVVPERPVYLGTLLIDNAPDGIVYRGHYIRILDEYDEAYRRLEEIFPAFVSSLSTAQIAPARHYMLRPKHRESPLEVAEFDDPIRQARDYISEFKFQQAINWLQTFMPASDRERNEMRLLMGEAYLGDGKFPEAIKNLGDALQEDPKNRRALRLLARAHLLQGDRDDALNLYGALAELLPGDAEAHLQLGYLYALDSDSSRSSDEFDSAFKFTYDYLLHDVSPFAMALKAVRDEDSYEYEPARVIQQRVRPPRLESRRGSEVGGLSVVIDHKGKVVAARLASGSGGSTSLVMISMIHSTFKPAALNGIPVPSLLIMDGYDGSSANQ
jgi:tetratricopeptide (TPR) repeat protein